MSQMKQYTRWNHNFVDGYNDVINSITTADIQAMAKTIFKSGNKLVVGMTSPVNEEWRTPKGSTKSMKSEEWKLLKTFTSYFINLAILNRQFHTKVHYGNYVLLAALLSVTFCLLWQGLSRPVTGIIIGVLLLFMLIIVERMVHTCYIITSDGKLIIDKGRLSKTIYIDISDIQRIDKIRNSSLVIVMNNGKEYFVQPTNEEDFIKCIKTRRKKDEQPNV